MENVHVWVSASPCTRGKLHTWKNCYSFSRDLELLTAHLLCRTKFSVCLQLSLYLYKKCKELGV